MLKKLKEIFGNAGCPACAGGNYQCLTGIGKDTVQGLHKEFRKTIRPVCTESPNTFQCTKCNCYWHLANSLLNKVPRERSQFYLNWLSLGNWNFEYDETFKQIGAFSYSERCLGFPCCVTNQNNEVIEKTLIFFTDFIPPFYCGYKDIFFVSDIKNISPSQYALPNDVRYRSHMAPEKAMCYAPTSVETSDGIKIILNNGVDFLDVDGIDPSKIKLSKDEKDNKALGYSERASEITVFVGKYNASLEKYRIKEL